MLFENTELVHRNDVEMDVFDFRLLDLTGERIQGFVVVECQTAPQIRYRLRCSCGNRIWKSIDDVNDAALMDCGDCYYPEPPKVRIGRTGKVRIMGILRGAIDRCHNPNSDAYYNYGARGVAVCSVWQIDPDAFYEWAMANGYEDHLTLDRIDNYRHGYSAGNCRWVTMKENCNNKRIHQDRREGRLPS